MALHSKKTDEYSKLYESRKKYMDAYKKYKNISESVYNAQTDINKIGTLLLKVREIIDNKISSPNRFNETFENLKDLAEDVERRIERRYAAFKNSTNSSYKGIEIITDTNEQFSPVESGFIIKFEFGNKKNYRRGANDIVLYMNESSFWVYQVDSFEDKTPIEISSYEEIIDILGEYNTIDMLRFIRSFYDKEFRDTIKDYPTNDNWDTGIIKLNDFLNIQNYSSEEIESRHRVHGDFIDSIDEDVDDRWHYHYISDFPHLRRNTNIGGEGSYNIFIPKAYVPVFDDVEGIKSWSIPHKIEKDFYALVTPDTDSAFWKLIFQTPNEHWVIKKDKERNIFIIYCLPKTEINSEGSLYNYSPDAIKNGDLSKYRAIPAVKWLIEFFKANCNGNPSNYKLLNSEYSVKDVIDTLNHYQRRIGYDYGQMESASPIREKRVKTSQAIIPSKKNAAYGKELVNGLSKMYKDIEANKKWRGIRIPDDPSAKIHYVIDIRKRENEGYYWSWAKEITGKKSTLEFKEMDNRFYDSKKEALEAAKKEIEKKLPSSKK